jgi:hypothetical protein
MRNWILGVVGTSGFVVLWDLAQAADLTIANAAGIAVMLTALAYIYKNETMDRGEKK